ncbi:MAG: YbgC/FadM family acyl-CoA thioesterase [Acidimicrobiia bacterium]|nr:YbgC/FadM family acyl-CoA thioesterase [Acidimicrobiia bacterium]
MSSSHTATVKVRFYELDPYDHVNHVNYLRYFETARVEFLSELGFGLDVMKDRDLAIVVVELHARFTGQAKLHDVIEVTTEVGEASGAVSTWHQRMTLDDDPIAEIDIKAAFTSLEGKARRIPPEFLEKVSPSPIT